MPVKPKCLIGDQALNDLVAEEYKQNVEEESKRFSDAKTGSSWLGKVVSNAFDYSGKSDFDFECVEAKQFIVSKIDAQTRADILFEDQIGRKEGPAPLVVELSLCDNDSIIDDMEESKLYSQELESRLSKHSKVAILRAFML